MLKHPEIHSPINFQLIRFFLPSQNFRHAEVYTTELVTKITTEKLMRLRSLYIDQLYRLKHVLREKRRNYLHAMRTERETLCSIHDQGKDTIAERGMYEKLKALNKYQRRNGVEAIMYKKFLEKRQKVSRSFGMCAIARRESLPIT